MISKLKIPNSVPITIKWITKLWLIYLLIFTILRVATVVLFIPEKQVHYRLSLHLSLALSMMPNGFQLSYYQLLYCRRCRDFLLFILKETKNGGPSILLSPRFWCYFFLPPILEISAITIHG